MKHDSQIRKEIEGVVNKYGVEIVSLVRNIQGSIDVELDHPIYYKENDKMEAGIRAIKGVVINDIFHREL